MVILETDSLTLASLTDGVAALDLDVRGRSVNVLSRAVLADFRQALDHVERDDSLRLLVIRSRKAGSFCAGADIQELKDIQSPEQAAALSELGQRLFDKLANLRIASVAFMHGASLGGGLELALACDYRVVVDDARTQLGLPEVELGLLPAWGGTQRLPRLIGLERALQMILGARRLSAAQALRWGLADHLAAEGDVGPPAFLAEPAKRSRKMRSRRSWRARLLETNVLGRWLIYRGAERILTQRLPEDMPAPWEALAAVKLGIKKGMEAGLAQERAAAGRLATSTACRNLVSLFLRRERARRLPDRLPEEEPPIRRVGVVGAGILGAGIVQLAVLRGCEVVIQEVNESALGRGTLRVLDLLNDAVARGVLSRQELEKKLAAVQGTTNWRGFATLDLVIEAAAEDLDRKRALFAEMEKHVAPSTILVSSTSSLRIQELQKGLQHPGRVAGFQFFDPVHKTPLVELAATGATSGQVITALQRFAVALGKVPIRVKDSPGFLVNRVLASYLNEAVLLVGEGMRIDWIDRGLRRFGMQLGPLETLDQMGLDAAAQIVENLKHQLDGRVADHAGFQCLQERGWRGQKTGLGFYRWRRGQRFVHVEAQSLISTRLQGSGARLDLTSSPDDQMRVASQRLVALMVNEAAACLGEGIAADADTIDLALVLGSGWAPHRGGPLRYARDRGYASVVLEMEELEKKHGPRFRACPHLVQLANPTPPT